MKLILIVLSLTVLAGQQVAGHGRVVDPPQRGSLWRLPEYAWANPGHQADDQELLCGGRDVRSLFLKIHNLMILF